VKITTYITEKQILLGLHHKKKRDVFKELLDVLLDLHKVSSASYDTILKSLIEREKLGSTAIGQGIAIPHARVEEIRKPLLVIGIKKEGMDFDSLDGEPVYVIFLIISSRREAGLHLKMLATISKLLRDKFFVEKLRTVDTPREVRELIKFQESRML